MNLNAFGSNIPVRGRVFLVVVFALVLLWFIRGLFGLGTRSWVLEEFGPNEEKEAKRVEEEATRFAEKYHPGAGVFYEFEFPLSGPGANKTSAIRVTTNSKKLRDAWIQNRSEPRN